MLANGLQDARTRRGIASVKVDALGTQRTPPPRRSFANVAHQAELGTAYARALSSGSEARVVDDKVLFLHAGSLVVVTALAGPGAKAAEGVVVLASDLGRALPGLDETIKDCKLRRRLRKVGNKVAGSQT